MFRKKNILEDCVLKYNKDCSKLFDELYSKIAYKEYGIKGETLIRGYYCPSMIMDIVTGNISRGKAVKHTSRKPSYEYGFNSDGKLLTVKYLYSYSLSYEFLIYDGRSVIGVTFSNNIITSINKCTYDEFNRIKTFLYGYDLCKNKFREYYEGIYSYDENDLKNVDYRKLFYDKHTPKLDREIYSFYHNSDGLLEEYSVYPSMFSDDKFKIKIKRRI